MREIIHGYNEGGNKTSFTYHMADTSVRGLKTVTDLTGLTCEYFYTSIEGKQRATGIQMYAKNSKIEYNDLSYEGAKYINDPNNIPLLSEIEFLYNRSEKNHTEAKLDGNLISSFKFGEDGSLLQEKDAYGGQMIAGPMTNVSLTRYVDNNFSGRNKFIKKTVRINPDQSNYFTEAEFLTESIYNGNKTFKTLSLPVGQSVYVFSAKIKPVSKAELSSPSERIYNSNSKKFELFASVAGERTYSHITHDESGYQTIYVVFEVFGSGSKTCYLGLDSNGNNVSYYVKELSLYKGRGSIAEIFENDTQKVSDGKDTVIVDIKPYKEYNSKKLAQIINGTETLITEIDNYGRAFKTTDARGVSTSYSYNSFGSISQCLTQANYYTVLTSMDQFVDNNNKNIKKYKDQRDKKTQVTSDKVIGTVEKTELPEDKYGSLALNYGYYNDYNMCRSSSDYRLNYGLCRSNNSRFSHDRPAALHSASDKKQHKVCQL